MSGNGGRRSVAVVGMACRFPGGADTPDRFWDLIRNGRDVIGPMPEGRFDPAEWVDPAPGTPGKMVTTEGGYLDDISSFDAAFFGISPREARKMDPQHRLLLELAWEALEDAGMPPRDLDPSDVGVYAALWTGEYENVLSRNPAATDFHSLTGTGRYSASGRISFAFDFRGPSMTVDTGCSGALVALHLARQAILAGEVDVAVVGAANLILQPHVNVGYSRSGMLSPGARCRFGDAGGSGYVRSEGAGVVILKRADSAFRDGDPVRGMVVESGVNADGRGSGHLATPSTDAQRALLETVYRRADVDPSTIPYVEAHGTGTRAGDPVELNAIGALFGPGREPGRDLLVGSVKTNIGHTEATAGMAGFMKALLMLDRREIPPSLHRDEPNPDIDWERLGISVPATLSGWPDDAPLRVGVSSFGITGTNAHVVVEGAPDAQTDDRSTDGRIPRIVVVSARTEEALNQRIADTATWAEGQDESLDLRDLEYTTLVRRERMEHRAAFVVETTEEWFTRLGEVLSGDTSAAILGVHDGAPRGRIGFVFSGQGSQWSGMGVELMERAPEFAATIEACDAAVAGVLDRPISRILGDRDIDEAPVDEIQPALVAFQIALARQLEAWGLVADAFVGHSMGEVSAACVAGAISIPDAMRIVTTRSRLLRSIAGRGGMALVDLPVSDVEAHLQPYEDRISVAAVNGPRSVVLAGDVEPLRELVGTLEERGVFAREVKVDVASHSHQVDRLLDPLRSELSDLSGQVDGTRFYSTSAPDSESPPTFDADYWAGNLRNPVRLDRAVSRMVDEDVDLLIEISPHPVLLSSLLDTVSEADEQSVAVLGSLRRDEPELLGSRGVLAEALVRGAELDRSRIVDSGSRLLRMPNYPWQKERHWVGNWDALVSGVGFGDDVDESDEERSTPDAYVVDWVPCEFGPEGEGVHEWLLLTGSASHAHAEALADSLSTLLHTKGESVHRVSLPASLEDGSAEAIREFYVEQVRSSLELAAGSASVRIVDLTPVSHRFDSGEAYASEFEGMCAAALGITHGAIEAGDMPDLGLCTVTSGSRSPTGRVADISAAPQAAVWGLRSASWDEEPDRRWSCVDLDPGDDPDRSAALLLAHCGSPSNSSSVAVVEGAAYRPVLRKTGAAPDPTDGEMWRSDGTYLVTGGLGDIGFRIALEMARSGVRHFLLLNRTELPDRAEWSGLDEGAELREKIDRVFALEEAGATVEVRSVDTSDWSGLSDTLRSFEASGQPPIRGVIHCAGVLNRSLLSDTDVKGLLQSLAGKACGAWHLHALLPEVERTIYTSSIIPVLPQSGQGAYGAANAVLDALSEARSGLGHSTHSMAWGVWKDTGLVKDQSVGRAADEMARDGLEPMSPDEAMRLFSTWHAAEGHTVLARFDWGRASERLKSRHDASTFASLWTDEEPSTASGPWVRTLDGESGAIRLQRLRERLSGHLGRILGVRTEGVHLRRPFGQQGLDSLMAMELRRRIETDFGRLYPASMVWNFSTVEQLADHLLDGATPSAAPEVDEGSPAPSEGSSAAWIEEIGDRSDADVLEDLMRGGS